MEKLTGFDKECQEALEAKKLTKEQRDLLITMEVENHGGIDYAFKAGRITEYQWLSLIGQANQTFWLEHLVEEIMGMKASIRQGENNE